MRSWMLLGLAMMAGQAWGQQAGTAQAGTAPAVPTLRTGTKLVVVDVTVTDSQHHPVRGLKREDFTLLEDGHAQTVKVFEEHSGLEPVKALPRPDLPPGTFSNVAEGEGSGPLNILLMDNLDTWPRALVHMRQQLTQYIDRAKPGTRMALFQLNHKLKLLQGFTTDKEKLKAAMGKEMPSSPHADPVSIVGTDDPGPVGDSESGSPEVINAWRTDAEVMRELARFGAGLPGRKNLLWFSGYFPMWFLQRPGSDPGRCKPCDITIIREFRQAGDMLAASEVAMYPINAHGVGGGTPENRLDRNEIAAMTGGRAFNDQNYMDQIAEEAIDDGSNYYTLTYSPSDTRWNGDYRKIAVKAAREGLELHYREGFYANDPSAPVKIENGPVEKPQKNAPKMGAEAAAATTALKSALEYGAPGATQVAFTVKVQQVGANEEQTPALGNKPNVGVKGPFRRYALEFEVEPRDIAGPAEGGVHHAMVEFVTFVYGMDGALINTVGMTIKADIPEAALAEGSKQKMPARAEVSVPVKGDYLLRFAVHDLQSDRVGSLETAVGAKP